MVTFAFFKQPPCPFAHFHVILWKRATLGDLHHHDPSAQRQEGDRNQTAQGT